MCNADFLLAVAQIGLTLAGITGILTMLRRTNKDWVLQDFIGIRIILELSFAAVFFALLPFPLQSMSIAEHRLWRSLDLLLACFWLMYVFIVHYRVIWLRKKGAPHRRFNILLGATLITFLVIIVLVFNPFQFSAGAAYMWGLMWLLASSGLQLFFLISIFTASLFEKMK